MFSCAVQSTPLAVIYYYTCYFGLFFSDFSSLSLLPQNVLTLSCIQKPGHLLCYTIPLILYCRSAPCSEAICQNSHLCNDTASWGRLPVLRPGSGGDEEGHRANEGPRSRWTRPGYFDRGWTGGCRALHGVIGYCLLIYLI